MCCVMRLAQSHSRSREERTNLWPKRGQDIHKFEGERKSAMMKRATKYEELPLHISFEDVGILPRLRWESEYQTLIYTGEHSYACGSQ